MNPFLFSHLTDGALRRGLVAAVPNSRLAYAAEVAHIAEFDARRLYAPEGYPAMSAFLVRELEMSEQMAKKLIRVARTALRFPEIFPALADGRLNGSGVILLAPWLTNENANELIQTASRRSNDEIRDLLANRAPQLDVPVSIVPLAGAAAVSVRTPDGTPGAAPVRAPAGDAGCVSHAGTSSEVSVRTPRSAGARPRFNPLGAGRYETRFTMAEGTREAIRYFEQLLGRKVTSEEMDRALDRGFKALAVELEKRRFGAADRPRAQAGPATGRRIPNAVKRAIWKRDEGRCTFIAENGRRCEARGNLEFDHIEPVARGGKSTVDNLRLRCRAHNQYEAEQVFGAGFMRGKRGQRRTTARRERAGSAQRLPDAKAGADARTERTAPPGTAPGPEPVSRSVPAHSSDPALDVTPWLLKLGIRKSDARRAAEHCEAMADATLEARVKAALAFLRPPARTGGAFRAAAPA